MFAVLTWCGVALVEAPHSLNADDGSDCWVIGLRPIVLEVVGGEAIQSAKAVIWGWDRNMGWRPNHPTWRAR